MKPYFLWSLIALSALFHSLLFYFLSGRSFYGFHKPSQENLTVSVNLLTVPKEEIKQPLKTSTSLRRQEVSPESFDQANRNLLEKNSLFQRSSSSESRFTKGFGIKLFGTSNLGYRFVYLLDVSGSMREKIDPTTTRLSLAKAEIQYSLESLPETAEFNLLLFADRVDSFSQECVPATSLMKAKAVTFLEKETPLSGGTDISGGLGVALAQWPDVIFLMTDGVANLSEDAFRSQWQYLYHQSKSRSQISVIGFLLDAQQENLLREIAEFTHGRFQHWKR